MRIYFCSDVHASEKCWRKFLASPKFYEADVVVLGGDITGKFIVPIIRGPNATKARFLGVERTIETIADMKLLKSQIADAGSYAYETTPDELAELQGNQALLDELFTQLVVDQVNRWVQLADERLIGVNARCFVSAGNDDISEVDAVLAESQVIESPEGRVVDIGEGITIVGVGYGNPTPWNCPRDISEEELAIKIDQAVRRVPDYDRAIFNFHVPPFGSGLDIAPRLNDDLEVVMTSAGPEMVPVGSTSVGDAIVRYEPMLGLHGHIHESKRIRRLGKTTVANPGSDYTEGILDGVVVDIDPGRREIRASLVAG